MARRLYTFLLWLLLPWVVLHLLLRSRRQPEYRQYWRERFGFYEHVEPDRRIWIHAVSVGETRAAQPLVAALKQSYPNHRILFTHMTPTGRATGGELFKTGADRAYLAYDYPGAVARFLDHWKPEFGIVMETELWPNLVAACRARSIPLFLANARLSDRSMRGYRRFEKLSRDTLGSLTGIAAQSDADAERLTALGARDVKVFGNIKFDLALPAEKLAQGRTLRAAIGSRSVFLCASTREGEEDLILDAWCAANRKDVLLVLVPRHPQRFDAVAMLITARGLRIERRSSGVVPDTETDVWLGDSLGEMFAYYAACDVAFIGGSLLDFGSQNLIEACAVGCPILLGPSTFNFSQAATDALAAGAAKQAKDAAEIVADALSLLGNGAARKSMSTAGLAFSRQHCGATAKTVDWLARSVSQAGH